jgi:hypothetical protein
MIHPYHANPKEHGYFRGKTAIMDYPQDQASRHCLNQTPDNFENWGLLVVQEGRIIDVQRWNGEEPLSPPKRPEGLLLHFVPDGQRLTLFMGKSVTEWNLITGWSGPRKYKKGERKKHLENVYKPVLGEPQFRCGKSWCCVIIDGNVKLSSPMDLFERKAKEWNELPATKRSMLLSEGARRSSARHATFALKAVVGLTLVAGLLYGLALLFNKMALI